MLEPRCSLLASNIKSTDSTAPIVCCHPHVVLLQVAVSQPAVTAALLSALASETQGVQLLATKCMARFAAWPGQPQAAFCQVKCAQVRQLCGSMISSIIRQRGRWTTVVEGCECALGLSASNKCGPAAIHRLCFAAMQYQAPGKPGTWLGTSNYQVGLHSQGGLAKPS